jgi:hypothetical protein
VMEKEDILDCLEALRHGLAVVDRRPSEELNFIERAKRAQYFMGLYALKLRVARMKEEHAKLKRSLSAGTGAGSDADSVTGEEDGASKHTPSNSPSTSKSPALDVDPRFPMFGGGIGFGPFSQGPMAPGIGPGPGGPGGFSTNGTLGRSMSGYLSESTSRVLFDDCYQLYVDKLFPRGIARYQLEELIVFEMVSWCSARLRETLDFKKLKKIMTYWEDIVDDPKGERQFLNFLELYHWSLLFELETEAEKFAESKIPEFYDKLAGRKALPEDIRQYEGELSEWLQYSTRRASLNVLAPFGMTQRRFSRLLEMYAAKYESVNALKNRWENYFQVKSNPFNYIQYMCHCHLSLRFVFCLSHRLSFTFFFVPIFPLFIFTHRVPPITSASARLSTPSARTRAR